MQKTSTKKMLLLAALMAMSLFAVGMMSGCGDSGTAGPQAGSPDSRSSDSEDVDSPYSFDGSVVPDYYKVEDTIDSSTNEGIGTVTAYSSDGSELWSAQTESYPMTELSKTYDIGELEDGYCVEAGGTVYCFDKADGALRWTNSDFQGATSACSIGADGNIYLCGYYGPMLYVISPEGETLARHEEPLFRSNAYDPADYYWPTELAVYDTYVTIKFDSNDQTLYVNSKNGHSDFEATQIAGEDSF